MGFIRCSSKVLLCSTLRLFKQRIKIFLYLEDKFQCSFGRTIGSYGIARRFFRKNFVQFSDIFVKAVSVRDSAELKIQALKLGIFNLSTRRNIRENAGVILKDSKLHLPNRIGLATGFGKNAEVIDAMLRLGFGFVECGTVTPRTQIGEPSPRMFRLPEEQGVINRLGFNISGLDFFARRLSASKVRKGLVGAIVGANKTSVEAGNAERDYVFGVKAVWNYVDYITLNISSPNTPVLRNLQYVDNLKKLLDNVGEVAAGLPRNH